MKIKLFFKNHWFFSIVIGYFLFTGLRYCKELIIIERNGVIVTVAVRSYDRKSFNKSRMRTVSVGYYYVNNRKYECFYRHEIPKDSTFRIKYNPQNPEKWHCIDE